VVAAFLIAALCGCWRGGHAQCDPILHRRLALRMIGPFRAGA